MRSDHRANLVSLRNTRIMQRNVQVTWRKSFMEKREGKSFANQGRLSRKSTMEIWSEKTKEDGREFPLGRPKWQSGKGIKRRSIRKDPESRLQKEREGYMVHDNGVVISNSLKWKMGWLVVNVRFHSYVVFGVVIHFCDQTRTPHVYDGHVDINRHRDRNSHLRGMEEWCSPHDTSRRESTELRGR